MFSKLIKAPFSKSSNSLFKRQSRFFATKPSKKEKITTPQVAAPSSASQAGIIPFLRDHSHLNYKSYPDVPHNDPKSPEYIHSERDEYASQTKVNAYNKVIEDLKRDIKTQEEIYRIIEELDRAPKHGRHGDNQTVSGGLRNYAPVNNTGMPRFDDERTSAFFNEAWGNEHRWTNQTIYHPKYAPIEAEAQWEAELASRPVNKHYHHDKGYKYDIETPWDQRYPHVADRMGYPEILGTPFERLMRLEGEIFHPTYLDQPFVQVPSSDPHESLNFEEGEVIYENARLLEWARFWNLTGLCGWVFGALFVPYNLLYKTHLPLNSAYDNLFVPHYNHTMFYFDNLGIHIIAIGGVAAYATYAALGLSHKLFRDYVVKLQYSKDKELLFVTRISPLCGLEEEVYEVHHLEILPPSVKTSVSDLSSQDPDGLWDITCLASHRNLVVYNEEKYWNRSLRKEFFDKVMNFWTPDLIEPSRLELYNEIVNSPKIEIGFEAQRLQAN